MSQFPLARILEFIRGVAPFESLAEEELDRVVKAMEIVYYPTDEVIVTAGGEPLADLHIIMSGSLKVSIPEEDGSELLVDMRGEGDVFGAVSILQSRQALFSARVAEDIIAFVLPGEFFRELVDAQPTFKRHFSFPLAQNLKAVRRLADSSLGQITGTESLGRMAAQMRRQVGELMSSPVLTCSPESTILEAARMMTDNRRGSIVVKNGADEPLGLVTDTDMRARVLSAGVDPGKPVREVMSSPVMTVSPIAFAFEALLDMTRHGVHHLVVCEKGRMTGVISDHDIKIITGSSPVGLAQEIDKTGSVGDLAKLQVGIGRVLEMLMRLGSSADYMTAVVTEFNDRLTIKLKSLTEAAMIAEGWGEPPSNFSWMIAGCAGRAEQIPPVRQLFNLIYRDLPPDKEATGPPWFEEFARRMVAGLKECGLSPIPEEVNGGSIPNCRSGTAWRQGFEEWLGQPESGDLETMAKLLDFRSVEGESLFARQTRQAIFSGLDRAPGFLSHLARAGTVRRPPLGFFRGLVLERDGEYRDNLDLETQVLLPMIDAIRVLALEHRIEPPNSLVRINELVNLGVIDPQMAADLKGAFSFAASLRITRFLEEHEGGQEDRSRINPLGLNSVQRKMLKASFTVIDDLQKLVLARYGLESAA